MKLFKYLFLAFLINPHGLILAMKFPEYKSKNLNGEKVILPEYFNNEKNIVIAAFYHEQQPKVNTWLEACQSLDPKKFSCYELPVIKDPFFFMKWIINMGMKSGIKSKEQRAQVITLYIDKDEFMNKLEINDDKDIYIFLVDKNGEILQKHVGEYSNSIDLF